MYSTQPFLSILRCSIICLTIASIGSAFANDAEQASSDQTNSGQATTRQADADQLGIVKEKPANGRYVQIEGGYMVPYTVTIPGTKVSFEMVPIPGGITTIGSPPDEEGRSDDEGGQFQVKVDPFWMSKCEVTWAEFKEFMKTYNVFKTFQAKGIRQVTDDRIADTITAPTPLYEPDTTFSLGDGDKQPAVTMSQYSAKQYTKWLSAITGNVYRLPSEFEWEHACRAGTTTPYSFGTADKIDDYAWYYDNSDGSYHDVGQKKPNPWGLHDMHGNVAELCLDQYVEDAYKKFEGKTVDAWDAIEWTKTMFPHVIRGGGWDCDVEQLRSAARRFTEDWRESDPNLPKSPWWFTDEPSQAVGFRPIRPLHRPSKEQQEKFYSIDNEDLKMAVEFRLEEGRGIRALVDEELPAVIQTLK